MCRLNWAFTSCWCNKSRNLVPWPQKCATSIYLDHHFHGYTFEIQIVSTLDVPAFMHVIMCLLYSFLVMFLHQHSSITYIGQQKIPLGRITFEWKSYHDGSWNERRTIQSKSRKSGWIKYSNEQIFQVVTFK